MSDLVEHSKAYHGYLVEFMRFHAPDAGFDETTVFSVDILSEIKSNDIARWMQLKAFGNPDPTPDALLVVVQLTDDRETAYRCKG